MKKQIIKIQQFRVTNKLNKFEWKMRKLFGIQMQAK